MSEINMYELLRRNRDDWSQYIDTICQSIKIKEQKEANRLEKLRQDIAHSKQQLIPQQHAKQPIPEPVKVQQPIPEQHQLSKQPKPVKVAQPIPEPVKIYQTVQQLAVKIHKDNRQDFFEKQQVTRTFHPDGTLPEPGHIFVFGSNLGGRHGLGAAKKALESYGAVIGHGIGRCGMSYAIPTKDMSIKTRLRLTLINEYVHEFVMYTHNNPTEKFFVTSIGCVLAKYKPEYIAPMFKYATNCSFPDTWKDYIENKFVDEKELTQKYRSILKDRALTTQNEWAGWIQRSKNGDRQMYLDVLDAGNFIFK
jgi:hypothetical protein